MPPPRWPASTATPRRPARVRPGVPAWLERTILDCLQRDPAARPDSAAEVRRRLAVPRRRLRTGGRPRWRLRRRRRHRRGRPLPPPVLPSPWSPRRPRRGPADPHGAAVGRSSGCSAPARSSWRCCAAGISLGIGRSGGRADHDRLHTGLRPRGPPHPATSTTRRRRSPPTATTPPCGPPRPTGIPAVLGKRRCGSGRPVRRSLRIDALGSPPRARTGPRRSTSPRRARSRSGVVGRSGRHRGRASVPRRPFDDRRPPRPRGPHLDHPHGRRRPGRHRRGAGLRLIGPCRTHRVRSDRRGRAG